MRELLAAYRDHEDLISIGVYRRGANHTVDQAIDLRDGINQYLRQTVDQPATLETEREGLVQLYRKIKG